MPSTFSWLALVDNASVTGESLVAQTTATINNTLVNTTNVDQVVVYTVTPTGGVSLCVGDNFTVSVTVHPEPVGVVNTATVCSDVVFGAGVTLTTTGGSVSAASYTIVTNANGLTQSAGTVSAGAGKNANELIDDAWTAARAVQVNRLQ
jgi:hypothetical protein